MLHRAAQEVIRSQLRRLSDYFDASLEEQSEKSAIDTQEELQRESEATKATFLQREAVANSHVLDALRTFLEPKMSPEALESHLNEQAAAFESGTAAALRQLEKDMISIDEKAFTERQAAQHAFCKRFKAGFDKGLEQLVADLDNASSEVGCRVVEIAATSPFAAQLDENGEPSQEVLRLVKDSIEAILKNAQDQKQPDGLDRLLNSATPQEGLEGNKRRRSLEMSSGDPSAASKVPRLLRE